MRLKQRRTGSRGGDVRSTACVGSGHGKRSAGDPRTEPTIVVFMAG